MKQGKHEGQPQHLYPWCAVYGHSVIEHKPMDVSARLLSAQHGSVLYCQRWLLGNITPAPVAEHAASFDLLRFMCESDGAAIGYPITPGMFMAALLMLEYPYRPALDGFWIGCTRKSLRRVARRQAAA